MRILSLFSLLKNKDQALSEALEKSFTDNAALKTAPEPMTFFIAIAQMMQSIENSAINQKDTKLSTQVFTIRGNFNAQELIPLKDNEPAEQLKKLDELMTKLKSESPYKLFAGDIVLDPIIGNELNKALKKIASHYDELKSANKIKTPRKKTN